MFVFTPRISATSLHCFRVYSGSKFALTERPPPLSGHVKIAVRQFHRNIKVIAFRQVHRATRYKQESGALNYAYIRASNNWFKSLAALAGTG